MVKWKGRIFPTVHGSIKINLKKWEIILSHAEESTMEDMKFLWRNLTELGIKFLQSLKKFIVCRTLTEVLVSVISDPKRTDLPQPWDFGTFMAIIGAVSFTWDDKCGTQPIPRKVEGGILWGAVIWRRHIVACPVKDICLHGIKSCFVLHSRNNRIARACKF